VAETRTTRLNLPQWSSGADSPSRDDFNNAFADLEARTAIDRRTPDPVLPTGSPALVDREYFQRILDLGGGTVLRALYRSDSGGTWRAQAWVPETLRVRPPTAAPPALTADALRIEHPTGPVAGLVSSWDGTVVARTALVLGTSVDGTLGRLSVGGLDAVPAAVRARITALGAERALEIKAGDANVTELLRMINSAGSNVLTVSGAGALTSTQGAAFGGVTPAASASLTVAPNSSGAINTGLLGYGQETANTRVIWQANRYQPGSTDAAAIFTVAPNSITIGRVTGTDWGALDIGAVLTRWVTGRLAWFPTIASMSGSSPFNPFPGLTGFAGIDQVNGMSSTIGTQFNNYGDPTRTASTVASYNSGVGAWTGDIQRGYQAEIIAGSPDAVLVSRIDPVGRMSSNAPWRGSGGKPNHLRDVRQSVVHTCVRKWADPGDYSAGQFVASNGSFTYTWPTMTVRSSSITQLEVELRLEALFFKQNSGANPDRQVMQIRWFYQIGSGSFNSADSLYQEAAAMVADSAFPQAPGIQNTWTVAVPITVAAGSTFRMRMQVVLYPYAADARLRRADLKVRESIVETYTASE
jgi:hypothetical protein